MKRRGRPPYPDILTPREWEVLELLREGQSNPEVAERLGVTRDAVKYHVSEILSTLAVATREEAAAWRPCERPWWAAAAAALGGAASRLSPLGRIAAIGASVAALAGLALLAWGVLATSDGDGEGDDLAVSSAPAPTVSGSGSGPAAPELTLGAEIPLPEDVALLLETGCFQCDGQTTGLIRVSRDADGQMHRDVLVSVSAHASYGSLDQTEWLYNVGDIPLPTPTVEGPKGPTVSEPSIAGMAVSDDGRDNDGREIVVGICYDCAVLGPVGARAAHNTILYRSADGGETWEEFGRPGPAHVVGILSPGHALLARENSEGSPLEFFIYPDGGSVLRPLTAGGVLEFPFALGKGTVGWPDRDGHVRDTSGADKLVVPFGTGPWSIGWVTQQPFAPHDIAMAWSDNSPGGTWFLSIFSAEGRHIRTLSTTRQPLYGQWVSANVLVANMALDRSDLSVPVPTFYPGLLPALIDLDSAAIHPIVDPFLKPGAEVGRNYVRGVQRATGVAPRLCTSSDLEGAVIGSSGLTMGQVLATAAFRNTSDSACVVSPVASVVLKSQSHAIMDTLYLPLCDPEHPSPRGPLETVTLAPGTLPLAARSLSPGQAALLLQWSSYDSDGPPCNDPTLSTITAFRVFLSREVAAVDSDYLDVPVQPEFDSVSVCGAIRVGWFTAAR